MAKETRTSIEFTVTADVYIDTDYGTISGEHEVDLWESHQITPDEWDEMTDFEKEALIEEDFYEDFIHNMSYGVQNPHYNVIYEETEYEVDIPD